MFHELIRRQEVPFHQGIDRNDLGVELQPRNLNRAVMTGLSWLRGSVCFQVGAYALVLLVFLALWLWRLRASFPATGALAASGLLYLALAFFVSPVPDYRFGHWTVLCALLAATVAVGSRRSC